MMRSFVAPRRRPPAYPKRAGKSQSSNARCSPGPSILMRPAIPEQIIQRTVCQHLRQRGARGLLWFHVPNGGRRSPAEAAIFAGLGVRAGVSDLILVHDGRPFALELKTERGRPSAAQMQFISEFRAAGGEALIVHGLNQALHTLENWKLLRGRAA